MGRKGGGRVGGHGTSPRSLGASEAGQGAGWVVGTAAHWQVGQFFVKDTHYRNQFETKTSGGLLKTSAREKWERGAALRYLCCQEECCLSILLTFERRVWLES